MHPPVILAHLHTELVITMLSPSERVRLMKEMAIAPQGNQLAKWEAVSQWLSEFEDSEQWAIVIMDGDRYPCVTLGFILECVWRSHWVAFDELDGYQRLLAGFKDIPEPLQPLVRCEYCQFRCKCRLFPLRHDLRSPSDSYARFGTILSKHTKPSTINDSENPGSGTG